MAESTVIPVKEHRLAALRGALREGSWRGAARMIAAMHPAEIALLIESLPPAQREVVWNFVEPEIEGDVLVELNENVRRRSSTAWTPTNCSPPPRAWSSTISPTWWATCPRRYRDSS